MKVRNSIYLGLAFAEQAAIALSPFLIAVKMKVVLDSSGFNDLMQLQAMWSILTLLASTVLSNYVATRVEADVIPSFFLTIRFLLFLSLILFVCFVLYSLIANLDLYWSFRVFVLSFGLAIFALLRSVLIHLSDGVVERMGFLAVLLTGVGLEAALSDKTTAILYLNACLILIVVAGVGRFFRFYSFSCGLSGLLSFFLKGAPGYAAYWLATVGGLAFCSPYISNLNYGDLRLAHNFSNVISVAFQAFDQVLYKKFKAALGDWDRLIRKVIIAYLLSGFVAALVTFYLVRFLDGVFFNFGSDFWVLMSGCLVGAVIGCVAKIYSVLINIKFGPLHLTKAFFVHSVICLALLVFACFLSAGATFVSVWYMVNGLLLVLIFRRVFYA